MSWNNSIIKGLRLKHGENSSYEDVAVAWMQRANYIFIKYFHETIDLGVPTRDIDARYDSDLKALTLMYYDIHVKSFGKYEIIDFIYAISSIEHHYISYAIKAYETLVVKTIIASYDDDQINLRSIYERSHLNTLIKCISHIDAKNIRDPKLRSEFILFSNIFMNA